MIKLVYSTIIIIFNPKSTGEAPAKARRLQKRLERKGLTCILRATEHAGHATDIAYAAAKKYSRPLIVSVSGDGGYNEVINGAMRAVDEGVAHQPVCAIMPAGNANDHRRSTRRRPLTWAIQHAKPEAIDILRLTAKCQGTTLTRYAHSYIGLGLTSKAAAALNREQLTRFKETLIVLRILLNFDPITIKMPDGSIKKLDSLVCANIHQMSKVIRLGRRTNLKSGLFRIVTLPHRNRVRMLFTVLSIFLFGYRKPPQTDAYEFTLTDNQPTHFDGEITKIPAHSHVRIECAPKALLTIR